MAESAPPVFRFAPSPNGDLHLGHAYSALLNRKMAREAGGRLLLRSEDIDLERCRPEYEAAMLDDLAWLGFDHDEQPARQSQNFSAYEAALDRLKALGVIYPAFMSRKEIVAAIGPWAATWPVDPDGAPLYPDRDRYLSVEERKAFTQDRPNHAWRLDMAKAIELRNTQQDQLLSWQETGEGPDGETGIIHAAAERWGDVVLARTLVPTSYHLAVVVDDAEQGVTDVVRGRDLFHATSVHRLLQDLLGLPQPTYHHHRLILDGDGRKLSKSIKSQSLRAMRESGLEPRDVVSMVGLNPD